MGDQKGIRVARGRGYLDLFNNRAVAISTTKKRKRRKIATLLAILWEEERRSQWKIVRASAWKKMEDRRGHHYAWRSTWNVEVDGRRPLDVKEASRTRLSATRKMGKKEEDHGGIHVEK